MQAFKCPHCGGDVRYDPASGTVTCEHCGGTISPEDYQQALDRSGRYQTNELVCPQCGAALLRYDDTLATFCPYCGSSVSFTRRIVEDSKPELVVPFRLTAEEALEQYRKRVSRDFFAPDWVEEEGTDRLVGIYMPYYNYNVTAEEKLQGQTVNIHAAGYESGGVWGDLQATYQELRFDAAETFPDSLSSTMADQAGVTREVLAKKTKPFEPSYLAGFYADGNSVREEDYTRMVEQMVRTDLQQQKLGYRGMELRTAVKNPKLDIRQQKLLYPIWLHTHRQGNRVCYGAIDGDTGAVAAELPIDRWRFLKLALILTAVFSLVLNQFLTLHPVPFLCVAGVLLGLMGRLLLRETRDVTLRREHRDDLGRIGLVKFSMGAKTKPRRLRFVSPDFLSLGWVILFFGFLLAGLMLLILFASGHAFPKLLLAGGLLILAGCLDVFLVCFVDTIFRSAKHKSIRWSFRMKPALVFKTLWRTILGTALAVAVLLTGAAWDELYYAAGVADLLLAAWSALDLIRQHNLLTSREIPVFTKKRGGDSDA